jgi:amino acid transporter
MAGVMTTSGDQHRLQRAIGSLQLFSLALGAILGAGWIIAVGQWIAQAGPVGTVLGFSGGAAVLSIIALCYAELGALYPAAGGEVAYAERLFGPMAAYYTGWFLAIVYIAVCIFSAISLGWIVEALVPGSHGPALYSLLGESIHATSLVIGVLAVAAVALVNLRGIRVTTRAQDALLITMISAFMVFVVAGLFSGHRSNLHPAFAHTVSRWPSAGVVKVLVTAPFWFSGFAVVAQALGEKAVPPSRRVLGWVFLLALNAACLFYCLVVIVTSMALPRSQLLRLDLPAAGALAQALHSEFLGNLVLFTGLLGLLIALNAIFYSATRVLYSLGRARLFPGAFARLDDRSGSPTIAVRLVAGLTLAGTALGRGAIMPLVDATSIILAAIYVMVCGATVRARLDRHDHPPTGRKAMALPLVALLASIALLITALIAPWQSSQRGLPTEFVLLGGAGGLGIAFRVWRIWMRAPGRTQHQRG